MLSGRTVYILDLVYAEVSGETECLVDIVSGLVEVSTLVVDMPDLVEFINPLRMRSRVTVVCLSVCLLPFKLLEC